MFVFFCGCNNTVLNSNSGDETKYRVTYDGGSKFQKIMPIIVTKCASCHEHSAWQDYSEDDFIDEGLVVNSNSAASPLYYRLSNALVGAGPRNMPQGGESALTDDEISKLEDWINGLHL